MLTTSYLECKVYLGSREGYGGPSFTEDDVLTEVAAYQSWHERHNGGACSARVSPCKFLYKGYLEPGWEVAVINYPRFPKKGEEVLLFAHGLAQHLLEKFRQNRVTYSVVQSPGSFCMLESEDGEESPINCGPVS